MNKLSYTNYGMDSRERIKSSSLNEVRTSKLNFLSRSHHHSNDVEEAKDVAEIMSHRHCFVNKDCVYHISIIDYLQAWDYKKKGERFLKTTCLGKDGPTLSAIEPVQYAARFKKFCEDKVFVE